MKPFLKFRWLHNLWKQFIPGTIRSFAAIDLQLIVYDFDGVMTDNRVLVLQDGTEGVFANRSDGLAVQRIKKLGIPQLILSTETNPVVQARAAKLSLEVISGCVDKKTAMEQLCRSRGLDLSQVLYVGNDLNDLGIMRVVGYSCAPADAMPEVRAIARYVFKTKGGAGVLSELAGRLECRA